MDDSIRKLQEELAQCRQTISARDNDILSLSTRLSEANEKLTSHETENASLKRLVERANTENDQLLAKLDLSENKAGALSEEVIFVKEALTESTMARDDVIEKLKHVSFETRELIDRCTKAYEENELYKMTTAKLEEEMQVLTRVNETLCIEKQNLQLELETSQVEIRSLQQKLESFNAQSSLLPENVWSNDVSFVNNELRSIEQQIKTIIANSRSIETEKHLLEEEIQHLKSLNASLQEQNVLKDQMITKHVNEFLEVRTTIHEYHSQILRLEAELKDSHTRVASMKEELTAIVSDNPDLDQFTHFQRSLARFGTVENMESLLPKLEVLQEIEEFFNKHLASHVDSANDLKTDSSDPKRDAINRIRSYLVKALTAIEKLNDKMIRLRDEYENKLQAKISEVSTVREVLSNTILCNKILEQTLQQYKDNVQTIGSETDEPRVVNETLLDGFDILKQLHRTWEQSNCFLYAKFEQLKFFTNLVWQYSSRALKETDEAKIAELEQKLADLFLLMRNTIEEMSAHEPNAQKLSDYQEVIEKCEKSLTAKDYLKNTVENMSKEMKRLTSKVEHEMGEKIREIEVLKVEIDDVKTDNLDLVSKIKSCNREIVSLSTKNNELNDKLQNLVDVENECKMLKRELDAMKTRTSCGSLESTEEVLRNLKDMYTSLRTENAKLKNDVGKYVQENEFVLTEAREKLLLCAANMKCDFAGAQDDLQKSLMKSLMSLKGTCDVLKKDNECLRADVAMFSKLTSKDLISGLHASLKEVLRNTNTAEACEVRSFESDDPRNEFSSEVQSVIYGIQKAVVTIFENVKQSFTISTEEMIKEMQEMNTELKKRGETISTLTQSLSDASQKNEYALQTIIELNERITCQEKQLETVETAKVQYSDAVIEKDKQIANITVEMDTLRDQIRSRDDIIVALRNDVQKQKEIQDGDVSSVGTLSRTEEASRLKDVEDTFEERYMKLKIVAVRMKKNIADLNQELKTERAERTTLQAKLSALANQAKMSQALQEECDKLNDDLELKNNEIKELKKIIQSSDKGGEALKNQINDFRRKIASSEHNITVLQKEKSELEAKLRTMSSEMEMMNREKQAGEIVKKEKTKEIQQLKQKMKELEESKESAKNELKKAMDEIRKQGALSLEMRDFERTISDLRKEVESKGVVIKELRAKLSSLTSTNESLAQTVKQLEERVSSYGENSKTMDTQIVILNKTISEHEIALKEREKRLKQMVQQLESEKSANETLTSQLATSEAEIKRLKDLFREKEGALMVQLQSAKSKCLDAQSTLAKRETEYNELRDDYEAYKAKAHNLIQKMKSESNANSNEQNLRKEIDTLYQTIRELKKQLDITTSEIDMNKSQLAFMETTKEKLQERVKELMVSVTEKSEEVKVARAEQRAYKLNADTLINCYKTEIDNLKISLDGTKLELQKALVKNEETTNSDGAIPEVTERTTPNSECYENGVVSNLYNGSHDSELENVDGSRTSGNKRRKHSLIPLETLLLSTKEEYEHEPVGCGNESELRANIKSLEEQVNYLTRILNESEKNAARNEQQVAFLKEEIRRLQRVFDREPHLRNTEYLKNVLMKFVTLPVGEERSQLVTVLETMLKLTQNEKQTLTGIAKGQRVDQKASGWSSYLGW